MAAYIVRRTLLSVFTIFVISFFSFVIIQLPPGDFVDRYAEQYLIRWLDQDCCTDEQMEELREQFGLDQPLMKQYWDWITAITFRADFGDAINYRHSQAKVPVNEIIVDVLPVTVALGMFTILITWVLAIPIGIYSAVRQHSIGDYAFTFLGFTGLAVPDFLLGLVLLYVFFAFFNQSVGGLYSGEYVDVPWSFGQGPGPAQAPDHTGDRSGHLRHRRPDPHNAEQPAG